VRGLETLVEPRKATDQRRLALTYPLGADGSSSIDDIESPLQAFGVDDDDCAAEFIK
jgi:hypothetical protein